jgi:hypothetical protein
VFDQLSFGMGFYEVRGQRVIKNTSDKIDTQHLSLYTEFEGLITQLGKHFEQRVKEDIDLSPLLNQLKTLEDPPQFCYGVGDRVFVNVITPESDPSKAHVDVQDFIGCFVFVFGIFTGGELVLDDLKTTIPIATRTGYYLDSQRIKHRVATITS